jgi:hypothetical protein
VNKDINLLSCSLLLSEPPAAILDNSVFTIESDNILENLGLKFLTHPPPLYDPSLT